MTITCTIVVHNPHKSSHVPGVVNVISRTQCTAPVPSIDGIVGLYRNGARASVHAGANRGVAALQLSTAAPCVSGNYQGAAIADIIFPPGFVPPGGRIGNRSPIVGIAC